MQSSPASLCMRCSLFPEQVTLQLGARPVPCSEELGISCPLLCNSLWQNIGHAAKMEVRIRGHQETVNSPSLRQAMRTAQVSEPAWRSDGSHPRKRGGKKAELAPESLPAFTDCPMLSWHLCVLSSATVVLQRPREAQPWSACSGQLENQHRNKPAASLPVLASQ